MGPGSRNVYCIVLDIITLNVYFWLWKVAHSDGSVTSVNRKRACIFPTVHQRKAMYECQYSLTSPPTENFHSDPKRKAIWWCSLTDNFDHYPEWQTCPETSSTYAGNQPGQTCHFPFLYGKKLHSTCIRSGGALKFRHPGDVVPFDDGQGGYWWCATTSDFDRDGQWTKCRPQHAHLLPCHFSIAKSGDNSAGGIVRGLDRECQPVGGNWLCRTELDQLRECPKKPWTGTKFAEPITEGGNDPGFPCHFPFQATVPALSSNSNWVGKATKRIITHCLPGTQNAELVSEFMYPPWIGFWCSTTVNFDEDHLWTRCTFQTDGKAPKAIRTLAHSEQPLAQLWSYLKWFHLLSNEERSKLDLSNRVYTLEFERSLRELETYRSQWEVAKSVESQEELQWWTWLAPFWWTSYIVNKTNQENSALHTSTYEQEETNPLSKAFNLPIWVESWSSAVSLADSGKSMNARWKALKLAVAYHWNKSWFLAYLTGLSTAVGVFILLVLFTLVCIEKSKRKELLRIMCSCGRSTSKQFINKCGTHIYSAGVLPGYTYCPRALVNRSTEQENRAASCDPPVQTKLSSNATCLFHPLYPVNESVQSKWGCVDSINSKAEDRTSIEADNQTAFITNSSSVEPFLCCNCSKGSACAGHRLSLKTALEHILTSLQKSEGHEVCESLNWHHLCDVLCPNAQPNHSICICRRPMTGSVYEELEFNRGCPNGFSCVDSCSEPLIEPSAPPPSYDQVTK